MECQCENVPCILIHGATDDFGDALIIEKMLTCKKAASVGYQSLLDGAGSVEAVEAALWWLECDEFFNCGYGSLLNEIGDIQMDASIIDGFKSECGSVAAVSDVEHPISLAKYVLNNFPNSIVVGEGAKKLVKYAKLNWLSKGNMIAPAAYFTYKLEKTGIHDANWDIKDHQRIKISTNSENTAGCIAYDGHVIAVGITSGGSNKNLVGSVGGSSILGCNAYANRNVGCTLTGHGETIMKLGLSRVIASETEQECTPVKALKNNLDYMLTKYNRIGGGVILKKSGEWDIYFTSNRMPYAVIANGRTTFGAVLDDEHVEIYTGHRKGFPCGCSSSVNNFTSAIDIESIFDTKLFSFREWQRYIECRRTVLINAHFPTRLKYNPNTPESNSLYIKFLESVHSKTDRDELEITTHKHLISSDLVHAMKQCITNVGYINLSLTRVNVFAPTLTPHYSYLQQLLECSIYDLPNTLRSGFFTTKVGYMTKSEFMYELALRYDIKLNVTNTNLHFVERIVPFFEQTKLASMKDLKNNVAVQDFLDETTKKKRKEDFIDYMHRKVCLSQLKIDIGRKQYYDNVRNTSVSVTVPPLTIFSEFIFDETRPDSKLAIPDSDDSENSEDDDDAHSRNVFSKEIRSSLSTFCKTYNISFSKAEKKVSCKNSNWTKRHKRTLFRNAHGKFVKRDCISPSIENMDDDDFYVEQSEKIPIDFEIENPVPPKIFDIPVHASIFHGLKSRIGYNDQLASCNKVFKSATNKSSRMFNNNILKLFRPFQNYWTYHCNFSRVKPKNFELFERMLPRSFRWLLNECAGIIEMTTEDLYEEICLVEAYHANICEQSGIHAPDATKGSAENRNKQMHNTVLSKCTRCWFYGEETSK